MTLAYITSITSVLILFFSALLSFLKTTDMRYQLFYLVAGSMQVGVITSIILINFDSKSTIVWPLLFLIHIVSKARDLWKVL